MDEDIARGLTVRDYRIAGMHHLNPAEVESVEEGRGLIYDYTQRCLHSWAFKHQSYEYRLEVLARGDIHCDGHRDIVLAVGLYNLHGTGRSDWYHVVLGGAPPTKRPVCRSFLRFRRIDWRATPSSRPSPEHLDSSRNHSVKMHLLGRSL